MQYHQSKDRLTAIDITPKTVEDQGQSLQIKIALIAILLKLLLSIRENLSKE
jgi:hypothetical protein